MIIIVILLLLLCHLFCVCSFSKMYGGLVVNYMFHTLGMDYVNHEDILPYSPTNNSSLQHELFPQFFSPSGDSKYIVIKSLLLLLGKSPFVSKDLLLSWHQKNICWLESVEVHRETNHNIRVTVMPFYMGSEVRKK